MKQLLPAGGAVAALLRLASVSAVLAQPVMQQQWPSANAPAVAPTGNVQVLFEPAPRSFGPAGQLWVYSAQRGGLRTGHSGQLAAAGRLLTFRPAYPFEPGEVVYATTWAAGAPNQPVRPQLWPFTMGVGGTGQGNFLPSTALATPCPAPGVVLGDIDNDGDLDLLTASMLDSQVRVRLNGSDASGSGTGVYDAGTLVEIGHPAYSLALGDVDGDGDLGLLTTNPKAS
jgi:hypothetical protein